MQPQLYRWLVLLGIFWGLAWLGQTAWEALAHAHTQARANTLTFGLIDDTPPFCFYGEDNTLVGINIDLVRELARRLGKTPRIESVSFNRLTAGLMTRQYDVVSIGSMTPERAQVVHFVTPHLVSADVLLVHEPLAHVRSLADFHGKPWRIGVYNGTSYIRLLQDRGLSANMAIYPNQRDVFLAFYKRRVDAIMMNEMVARYIRRHVDPAIVIVPERVRTDRRYAFAVRHDNPALWQDLEAAMQATLADGTFDRIQARWMNEMGNESGTTNAGH